jgi:hypothetical protein
MHCNIYESERNFHRKITGRSNTEGNFYVYGTGHTELAGLFNLDSDVSAADQPHPACRWREALNLKARPCFSGLAEVLFFRSSLVD